ncbi:DUF5659 domain-containing protein [Fictibacillus sp. JL2B1089]|uniref:DUF5659 domain-containing protein n=1 Tax=Fictibacillus sp. JL2B1089 TaxID=3399565 RepID=UPI003A842EE5
MTRGFKWIETGVLEEDGKKKAYLVFEECKEVAQAIREYKKDQFLKEYASNFKELKSLFNDLTNT